MVLLGSKKDSYKINIPKVIVIYILFENRAGKVDV